MDSSSRDAPSKSTNSVETGSSVVNHIGEEESGSVDSPYPIEEVTIVKAGGPLGLSIVGGSDHSSHPFGMEEPGVFVSKIVPDGAAAKTKLKIGDRILSVNNRDVTGATHQEAVMLLISPTYEINLKVRHDPPPPGLKVREQRDAWILMSMCRGIKPLLCLLFVTDTVVDGTVFSTCIEPACIELTLW